MYDYQKEWRSLIASLRNYELEPVKFLSISSDAPKDFITDSEYRPVTRSRRQRRESYIVEVGSKFYPNESITARTSGRSAAPASKLPSHHANDNLKN
jgi:hypothetical protein